jgi:endonuclease YncB( thermonuclease family)
MKARRVPFYLRLAAGPSRPKRRARKAAARTRIHPLLVFLLLAALLGAHALGVFPWARDRIIGPPGTFDISGTASIVDGDTLTVAGTRIRLSGIDAPEKKANCTIKATGERIACGAHAGEVLRSLAGRRSIGCVAEGEDRYGRTVAACYATQKGQRIDIARAMVRQGWALAYRRYSDRYVLDETAARLDGAGLWAMEFQNPEDYRREARAR